MQWPKKQSKVKQNNAKAEGLLDKQMTIITMTFLFYYATPYWPERLRRCPGSLLQVSAVTTGYLREAAI